MEEDADLRGPPVGDRRRGSGQAVAQGKSCARLNRGVGPRRGGRVGPHFRPVAGQLGPSAGGGEVFFPFFFCSSSFISKPILNPF